MGAIALPLALWQHDDPQRLAATLDRAWADQGLTGRSPTLSAIAHLWAQWLAATIRTGHHPNPSHWLGELATLPTLPAAALHLAQSLHVWAVAAAPIHWVQAAFQRWDAPESSAPDALNLRDHPLAPAAAIALYVAMTTPSDFPMRLGRLQRAIAPPQTAWVAPWLGAVTGAERGYTQMQAMEMQAMEMQAMGAIAFGQPSPGLKRTGGQGMTQAEAAALLMLSDRLWAAWAGWSPTPMPTALTAPEAHTTTHESASHPFPNPNLVIKSCH